MVKAGRMSKIRNIGYACKTIGVRDTAMRACRLGASPEQLLEVALHNIAVLGRMIEYTARSEIGLLRISSDVIPLASHPEVCFNWSKLCAAPLAAVGELIRNAGIRVSMHPGQYTVLNSPDEGVALRAAADLVYHAEFLDSLGADSQAKIVLHVGGVYGDRQAALQRFAGRFAELPPQTAGRIILENDEKCFAVHEVYALSRDLGVPVVMDVFHHTLLPPPAGSALDWLERCGETWRPEDGRQKIHYSEQLSGGKPGMHSRTIDAARFLNFYAALPQPAPDIMLEVKDKNLSAVKCLHCVNQAPRSALGAAWANYKYSVLERSPRHYQLIREYLKAERPDPAGFYALIDAGLEEAGSPGTRVVAAEHVWGYFKGRVSAAEKKHFAAGLKRLAEGGGAVPIKRLLFNLAEQCDEQYLLDSLYFYLE